MDEETEQVRFKPTGMKPLSPSSAQSEQGQTWTVVRWARRNDRDEPAPTGLASLQLEGVAPEGESLVFTPSLTHLSGAGTGELFLAKGGTLAGAPRAARRSLQ